MKKIDEKMVNQYFVETIMNETNTEEDRFTRNLNVGVFPFLRNLQGEYLDPMEAILARCAKCVIFREKRSLTGCPDKRCPLYDLVVNYDPRNYISKKIFIGHRPGQHKSDQE